MYITTTTSDILRVKNIKIHTDNQVLLLFGFGAMLQTFLPELQTNRVCLEFKRGCPHCGPRKRQLEGMLTTDDYSEAVPSCPVLRGSL